MAERGVERPDVAMHWSKTGANDILPLCACIRSGLYNDFWRQRRRPPPRPSGERT